MSARIHINNVTRYKVPRIAFEDIKDYILGTEYDITLNFVTSEYIKELNTRYRDKNESTDILSFPLHEQAGEIYISFEDCDRMRHEFGRTLDNFIAFLFIHGCTHLKGHDHGRIMDGIEARARAHFGI